MAPLEQLSMSHNLLSALPANLTKLKALTDIDLSYNR